ncbi:MAG TPA: DUF4383 domain-containing protein [Thermoleophilaceae bacterium]|nr:DUF4383 domain-containing protein [Thermoleophilaceae bacterium]
MDAPRAPAQQFALLAGLVLLALGVLTLVIGGANFGTADQAGGQEFLIMKANGWDSVVWITFGSLGVSMASELGAARVYGLVSGAFFVTVAVWGFIDGNDAFGLMALDTTANIFHAAIGGLGLVLGSLPKSAHKEGAVGPSANRSRPREPFSF